MDLHSQAIEFNPIYILSIYILSVLCLYTPYSYSTINCRCISPSYLGPQIHPPRWTKTDSKGGSFSYVSSPAFSPSAGTANSSLSMIVSMPRHS